MMMNKTNQSLRVKKLSAPGRQAGVVLVMALVMLMVLTLIGVSSMSSSTLEMKVATNMQQHNTA
ncbi:MAG: pilus assembly protein PilX, partial [Gammaproteobacteria bacterium]|nr:pilus assembly protein PilX [Gammaproteobacteria bacterium]